MSPKASLGSRVPTWFDLKVLFYTDSLNKTRSLFYIKVYEAKKALIEDIGPVKRVQSFLVRRLLCYGEIAGLTLVFSSVTG